MDIELLKDGLDRMGIAYDGSALVRFETYMSELMLFNPAYRLVAQDDEDEILIRHFLDSAAAVPYLFGLDRHEDIIDLGSGAGFPGLVLAILMPESRVTLAERMSRRVAFLRNAVLKMELSNVEIVEKNAEDVDGKWDIVTSRAFHPVSNCLAYARALVREGGRIVFYKGPEKNVDAEMSLLGGKVDYSTVRLCVPYLDEARSLLVIA